MCYERRAEACVPVYSVFSNQPQAVWMSPHALEFGSV
jgi:hypothetical protein